MNSIALEEIERDQAQLRDTLSRWPRVIVLTGAGISIASGIPAYRDHSGRWLHSTPIQHREFLAEPRVRQRYWARSLAGWPAVRDARPSATHRTLAILEQRGQIELLVTQNVDRLHQRAGSARVVDLHGRLDRVLCLHCGDFEGREVMQQRLLLGNPGFDASPGNPSRRPDGDSSLSEDSYLRFQVPACRGCGGVLIPDVVFFGGTVPRNRVEQIHAALARADALWVIGSSLHVYSGFRFCREATRLGKPIILINPGASRADALSTVRFHHASDALLPGIVNPLPQYAGQAPPGSEVGDMPPQPPRD